MAGAGAGKSGVCGRPEWNPGEHQHTAIAARATAIAGDASAASAASAATGVNEVSEVIAIVLKQVCVAAAGATPTAEAERPKPAYTENGTPSGTEPWA